MSHLFLTEGSHLKGMGDVYAVVPVAECLRQMGEKVAFIVLGRRSVSDTLCALGLNAVPARSLTSALRLVESSDARVVVFSRRQTAAWAVRSIRSTGRLTVTFDDVGPGSRAADLRVNPLYHVADSLHGTRFLPLRLDFLQVRFRRGDARRTCRNVLLTQGGADTRGFMPTLLAAVDDTMARVAPGCAIWLVAGPCFTNLPEIRYQAGRCNCTVHVLENVTNMASLMEGMDLAVSAGGVTMYELCCVGVPTLVACAEPWEAESSAALSALNAIEDHGFADPPDTVRLGRSLSRLLTDPERRSRLGLGAREAVDGRGAERIAARVRALAMELE